MSRRVFVSAPYRGEVERNKYMTDGYAKQVLEAGHIPFVPHSQYEWTLRFYPPTVAHIVAMYLCCRMIDVCDEVWFWGEPTEGMEFEINYAKGIGKVINERNVTEWQM